MNRVQTSFAVPWIIGNNRLMSRRVLGAVQELNEGLQFR
jgi:hypothetical protein